MQRVAFQIEFIFRASPTILYRFFTTPSCLVRWFCDGVDIVADEFAFTWDGSEEMATLVDDIEDERVRFTWDEADEGEYFEFRMEVSPVTNETILYVTDYRDEDEVDDQKKLWESQMEMLRRETGG